MRPHSLLKSAIVLALTVSTASAIASTERSTPSLVDESILVEGGYGGFLSAHPDLRHYQYALGAYFEGDYVTAMRHFRKAARYADKPSQALIAEMLWKGQGVAPDRALAYAWMDLAAERGSRRFLIQRERYWKALNADEQADALARGAEIYAEFGDDVAMGRQIRMMRRVSKEVAGSRTGFGASVMIHAAGVGSGAAAVTTGTSGGDYGFQASQSMPAVAFFAPKLWKSDQYFTWRDNYWERKLQTGLVEVGEVEQADRERRDTNEPQAD